MSTNKVVNVVPYLAIEERPNSFVPIDLSLLDIVDDNINFMTLEDIDRFTAIFTEEEIRNSIIRSNIVKEEFVNQSFVIIYKSKPYDVITKDNFNKLDISEVVKACMNDKQEANKFWNKVNSVAKKYCDSMVLNDLLKNIKHAFALGDISKLKEVFSYIPYIGQREIAFYYYDIQDNSKEIDFKKLKRAKEE